MGNEKYWDEKFAQRSDNPLTPESSLVKNIKYFKRGSVLDIACGDGRNTLFLLENNFIVTGVDFSSKALERLELFAKKFNYAVDTQQIDLNNADSLKHIGIFDNILVNHYRLNHETLMALENHISNNGILFICGFGHEHKVDQKIRKDDLIQPTDFKEINNAFELMEYLENEDDRGFIVTYIFRRK